MSSIPTLGEEARIRECIEALAKALRAKDVESLMVHYAPDMVTFDLRPPLRVVSAAAYRRNFEAWFSSVQGPIHYDIRELRITVSGEAAFCHSLCHVMSTRIGGEKADYWVRVTSGFQKRHGDWKITHEHVSVPVNLQTLQAAFDQQP